jgi:hypothetical protein
MTVIAWQDQVQKLMKDKTPHLQVVQQIWIIDQLLMQAATGHHKHVVPGSQPKELLPAAISMARFQTSSKHNHYGC